MTDESAKIGERFSGTFTTVDKYVFVGPKPQSVAHHLQFHVSSACVAIFVVPFALYFSAFRPTPRTVISLFIVISL